MMNVTLLAQGGFLADGLHHRRGLRGSRFLQRPPIIWRGVVWVACGDVARRPGMVFVSHGSATPVSDRKAVGR